MLVRSVGRVRDEGFFYDIVRCRLAVAEVSVLVSRFESRFTRSRAASAPPCLEALESRNLLSNASGVWSFASAPRLHPMKVNVLTLNPGADLNPIFVAAYAQSANPGVLVGQNGPLIMDASGNPIWFHPTSSNNSMQVFDFHTQTLYGKPVLIWWQGTIAGTRTEQLTPWHAAVGPLRHLQPTLSKNHDDPRTERKPFGLSRPRGYVTR